MTSFPATKQKNLLKWLEITLSSVIVLLFKYLYLNLCFALIFCLRCSQLTLYLPILKMVAIFLKKLAIFDIYIFAPFVKLHGCRFLYFFSLCDVRNEVVFLIVEHSSLRGVKLEKHKKKHEILAFKPLLQEIQLKNQITRKIF